MKRVSLRHTMHASHLILSSPITLWKLLRYTLTFSLLLNWILHRNSPVVSWSSCTRATDVYKFAKSFKILLIARIFMQKRRSKRIGAGLQLDNLQLQLDSYADRGEPSEFKCGGCSQNISAESGEQTRSRQASCPHHCIQPWGSILHKPRIA